MELVPWKPFRELGSLRKEMYSLWDRFFGGALSTGLLREAWAPSVDISETKERFVVKAELPGLDAKDVNVSILDDQQRPITWAFDAMVDRIQSDARGAIAA